MAIDWDDINAEVDSRTSFSNLDFPVISDTDKQILAQITNKEEADAFIASRKSFSTTIAEYLLKLYPK